jgi:hypothetical protein
MTELTQEQNFVASSQIRTVVRSEIQKFADKVLAEAIGTAVGDLVRECERRCTAKLEDAMKECVFKGQWTEGQQYRKHNLVSMGGAIYYCNVDSTDSRPGVGSDWALLVPKPRDGRDGKAMCRHQNRLSHEQR